MAKKNERTDLTGIGIEVHDEVAWLEVKGCPGANTDFPIEKGYQKIGVVMDGVFYHDSRINSITIDLPTYAPTKELGDLMDKHGVE